MESKGRRLHKQKMVNYTNDPTPPAIAPRTPLDDKAGLPNENETGLESTEEML